MHSRYQEPQQRALSYDESLQRARDECVAWLEQQLYSTVGDVQRELSKENEGRVRMDGSERHRYWPLDVNEYEKGMEKDLFISHCEPFDYTLFDVFCSRASYRWLSYPVFNEMRQMIGPVKRNVLQARVMELPRKEKKRLLDEALGKAREEEMAKRKRTHH